MTTSPLDAHSDGMRLIRRLEIVNLVMALLAIVLTHVLAGAGSFLWGVVLGAGIGVLNLRAMIFLGRRLIQGHSRSRALWATLFILKLAILGTLVWLSLSHLPVDSLGFLIGFSTLLPSALILTFIRALERAPASSTPTTIHGERRL